MDWFKSYVSNRKQSVRVGNATSPPLDLIFGVLQGSVLGPVLFVLYAAPVNQIIQTSNVIVHFYADDTQCYTKFNLDTAGVSQRAVVSTLMDCVKRIDEWLHKNKLKNNSGKLAMMFVSSAKSKKQPIPTNVDIDGVTISPSTTARNLGVNFDCHLSFEHHILDVCRRGYYQLRRIRKIRQYLGMRSCSQLVCTLILPLIDYASSLLYGLQEV